MQAEGPRPIKIAVAPAKGGSMKSSLCAALAVQAVATGARVDLLDWEPQGSLTYWWTVRRKPDNPRLLAGPWMTPAEAAANSDADFAVRYGARDAGASRKRCSRIRLCADPALGVCAGPGRSAHGGFNSAQITPSTGWKLTAYL
jgi:CobQ/CobB/MinD/ParA nucleotide binding domain